MISIVKKDYQLHFDRSGYTKKLDEIKAAFKRQNEYEVLLAACSTEVEHQVKSLSMLETKLRAETHFKNLLIAADAFGIKKEYIRLQELEAAGLPKPKHIDRKDGMAVPKETFLEEVKESYVSYLPEEYRDDFDKIQEALSVLNRYSGPIRHSVIKTPDGIHDLNIHRYDEARRLLKKSKADVLDG